MRVTENIAWLGIGLTWVLHGVIVADQPLHTIPGLLASASSAWSRSSGAPDTRKASWRLQSWGWSRRLLMWGSLKPSSAPQAGRPFPLEPGELKSHFIVCLCFRLQLTGRTASARNRHVTGNGITYEDKNPNIPDFSSKTSLIRLSSSSSSSF